MATIRKKGDFQYHVQIRKKGFPSVTRTFETKIEAENWAVVKESEMVRGVYADSSDAERTSLCDLIDRFTAEFAPNHYRVRVDMKEAWRYQASHLKRHLGAYSLAALDQNSIVKYRQERLKQVSESTVRKELFMLSKILNYGELECGISLPRGNPVSKIRKPAEARSRERRLTKDEWDRLIEECKSSRNVYLWWAVELAVETAARQGELLSLKWKDVDLKRRFALFRLTKNGESRAAPLSPRAMAILAEMPHSIDGLVLPVQRMTLYHAFHAAVLRAKIKDYTYHDLRHEALSRLAEGGGFSVLELSSISGHKSLQMLQRYTHLQAENLAKKLANER